MNNHIYRHGLMPKKTFDGRRWIYFYKEKPAPRPAPNYKKTIICHQDLGDGSCGFNHTPYASNIEFRNPLSENDISKSRRQDTGFGVWTTVAHVGLGAESCGFCRILWLGLQRYRPFWEAKGNVLMGLDYLSRHMADYSEEEYYSLVRRVELGELSPRNDYIDDGRIYFSLFFPKANKFVQARLLIEPRGKSTWDSNRLLMALDYHTLEGKF